MPQTSNSASSAASQPEKYPPNDGAFGGWHEETLQPGTVVDRYGELSKTSRYASPFGTPSDARSLLPGTNENKVDIFMVSKPIKVDASVIAPWGSSHGGGIQYRFQLPIKELMNQGFLIKIP